MQVSIETTTGLERRMTVDIPKQKFEQEVQTRLKSLAGKVKLPGFRPGKVPFGIIKKKYGVKIHQEVMGEMVQSSFYEAVSQEKLRPAGLPQIEQKNGDDDFGFTATFEVYPDINLSSIDKIEVEKPTVEINEPDIEKLIETLRKQQITWEPALREAKNGDRITIDYTGTVDGESFAGGDGTQIPIELGSKRMIPGFEDQLEGIKLDEERELSLVFPEQYHAQELASKAVIFKVKATKIEQSILPQLDDAFAQTMGVKEGGMAAFRKQIKVNMQREVEQNIKNKTKQSVLDGLLANVDAELPKTLLDREINTMIEQQKAQNAIQDYDVGTKIFEQQARRRVALGLILSEVAKENDLKASASRIREIVESIASGYEKPEEVVKYYYGDKNRLLEIENVALEELVVEWVLGKASIKEINTSFDALMNQGHAKA